MRKIAIVSFCTCLFIPLLVIGCSKATQIIPSPTFTPAITPVMPTQTMQATEISASQTPEPAAVIPTETFTQIPTQATLPPAPLYAENTRIPDVQTAISSDNADRVAPLAQWGKGSIQDVAYSPDGALLGVASSLGVYLYESQSLKLVRFFPTDLPVTALQFSPDQKTFAWGFANGRIEIHHTEDGSLIQDLESGAMSVIKLAYSDDGSRLIALQDYINEHEQDSKLFCWDLVQGKLISSSLIPIQEAIDLSEGGQTMAWTDYSNIQVIETNSQETQSISFNGYPYFLKLSSNGKTLLFDDGINISLRKVDQSDKQVVLSGIPEYQSIFFASMCHKEVDGPGFGSVQSAAFSPDGNLLVLGARQGVIQIRRVSDGAMLSSIPGWADKLLFAPDSKRFVLLPGDGTLEIHAAVNGALLSQLTGHTNAFTSVAFSPDGKLLTAGAADEKVRVWHIPDGTRALDLQTQADQVAFSPDGGVLATGSHHGGVTLWNLTSGDKQILQKDSLPEHDILRINSMRFTPDGKSLMAGSQGCELKLWDALSGQAVWNAANGVEPWDIYSRNAPVKSLTASSDSRLLASSYESTILFFDLAERKRLTPLSLDDFGWITQMAFFPDGNRIAVGAEGKFQVWDLKTSMQVYSLDEPSFNLALSKDGRLIATSDAQGTIYLWRAEDGQRLAQLGGHRSEITQLAFSNDGKFLASSSQDGTIRLWGIP